MVSEISGSSPSHVTALDGRLNTVRVDTGRPAPDPDPQLSVPGEVVTLTDLASRLQELTKSIENVPVVDAQRVDGYRRTVSDGSYQVQPEVVADKLISFENSLTSAAA